MVKEKEGIKNYSLSEKTKEKMLNLLRDYQKPHVLGDTMKEILFLNDNIILTEGQDDVIILKQLFEQKDISVKYSFFGWGAGGLDNVPTILNFLKELGYKKIFIIVDNINSSNSSLKYIKNLKSIGLFELSADDIRDKKNDNLQKIKKDISKLKISFCENKKIEKILQKYLKETSGMTEYDSNLKAFTVKPKYKKEFDLLIHEICNYFEI